MSKIYTSANRSPITDSDGNPDNVIFRTCSHRVKHRAVRMTVAKMKVVVPAYYLRHIPSTVRCENPSERTVEWSQERNDNTNPTVR